MPEIQSDYCNECICHEDGTRHPDASGGWNTPTWSSTWQWTTPTPWFTGSTGSSWGQTTTWWSWWTGESTTPITTNGPTTEPGIPEKEDEITEKVVQVTDPACSQAENVGDGFCDDATNIESCNYDGGDCCNKDAVYMYCKECTCHPDAPQSLDEESLEPIDEDPILCLALQCNSSSTTSVLSLFCVILVFVLTMS